MNLRKKRVSETRFFVSICLNSNVMTFLEYYGAKLTPNHKKSWDPLHRSDNWALDINKIPDCRQHDATLHPKVEKIRTGASNMEVLAPNEVQEICGTYKITDLDPNTPRKLSNMPISIKLNPATQQYILVRDE